MPVANWPLSNTRIPSEKTNGIGVAKWSLVNHELPRPKQRVIVGLGPVPKATASVAQFGDTDMMVLPLRVDRYCIVENTAKQIPVISEDISEEFPCDDQSGNIIAMKSNPVDDL